MEGHCGYIYEHLAPSEGAVSDEVVDGGGSKDIRTEVKHVTADGLEIREKKPRRACLSVTENAVRMREMRKGSEYRSRENERRKERRKNKNCAKYRACLYYRPTLMNWKKTVELLQKRIEFTKMWNWFKSLLLFTKNLRSSTRRTMHNAFCTEVRTVILDQLGPPKISKILALLLLHCNSSISHFHNLSTLTT